LATRSRLWKITRVVLYVLGAALLVFFFGVVPWFLTNIATTSRFHFRDPNDANTPQSYSMDFQEVEFKSSDGIDLKGWYVPARPPEGGDAARGTIVYCHGHNRTRVEMLPEAVFAHGLGYNGLLFDLRHQGASGGNVTSVGYWERLDAEAAVRYALEEKKAARPVILWGVSMGAAAALLAAAESPQVDAVISDSTLLNFKDVVLHHYYLFRGFIRKQWWWFPPLPAFPIAYEVLYGAAHRAHFQVDDFDVQKAVKRIGPRPILFIAVEGDPRMPPSIAQTLYADSESPLKQLVVLPGSRHGEGFKLANQPYEEAVRQFLSRVASEHAAK